VPAPVVALASSLLGGGAFNLDAAFNLAGRVFTAAGSFFSEFQGAITVRVVGGPHADIRRIWYLALAAAFGRYRNRTDDSLASIAYQGTWDVTGKAVQIEIAYTLSRFNQAAFSKTRPSAFEAQDGTIYDYGDHFPNSAPEVKAFLVDPSASAYTYIQRGPEQLTVGAHLPHWLQNRDRTGPVVQGNDKNAWQGPECAKGRPVNPEKVFVHSTALVGMRGVNREWPRGNNRYAGFFTGYPYRVMTPVSDRGATGLTRDRVAKIDQEGDINLPDDGRVITTADKTDPLVQPPQPPSDGSSRSSLVALVAQALTQPCMLPPSPPCTRVHRGGTSGRFVWHPGHVHPEDVIEASTRIQAAHSGSDNEVEVPGEDPGRSDGVGVDGYKQHNQVPNLKD
jgi:hypothetical protein